MTKQSLKQSILLALVGIVPATISGLFVHCQAAIESRWKAKVEAESSTNAVIESFKPAIKELQDIAEDSQEQNEALHRELTAIKEATRDLYEDVEFCKGYITADSKGRYKPPKSDKRPPMALRTGSGRPAQAIKRPTAKLPPDAKAAKAFEKERQELGCAEDAPLCGVSAFKNH